MDWKFTELKPLHLVRGDRFFLNDKDELIAYNIDNLDRDHANFKREIANMQSDLIWEISRGVVGNPRKEATQLFDAITNREVELMRWYDAQKEAIEGLVK